MELLRICGFCLTALVLVVLLKQYLPVYAAVASLAAVLGLLVVISGWLAPFLHWIQTLPDFPQSENFKYLLKAAGIVLVSQCLQELCRDAGQGALAYAADLAGRCLVLLTALPMMQRALDVLLELLQ